MKKYLIILLALVAIIAAGVYLYGALTEIGPGSTVEKPEQVAISHVRFLSINLDQNTIEARQTSGKTFTIKVLPTTQIYGDNNSPECNVSCRTAFPLSDLANEVKNNYPQPGAGYELKGVWNDGFFEAESISWIIG